MKSCNATVLLAAAVFSSAARAQVLDWLPISDLPLTSSESNGGPITPAVATMCMWDPDGSGPKPRCVVVAGTLGLAQAGPDPNLAYLDENGWVPVPTPSGAYSIAAYRSPLAEREDLFYASSSRLYRRDGNAWTLLRNISSPKTMQVLDLDGDGPQPPKLLISNGVYIWVFDGASFVQLGGSTGNGSTYSLAMWDTGSGLKLLSAGSAGVAQWDGTQWSMWATANRSAYAMTAIDFDGDGPGPTELVVSGSFDTFGGVSTGAVVVRRNGTWLGLGAALAGQYIARSVAFDPDGSGPMTPRLVVAGLFSAIGGASAPNLAYYDGASWQTFPEHWHATATCLGINAEAAYSDSPQLVVGALQGIRPAVGIIALCDMAPGYAHDPAGGRRPAGETLSLGVIPTGDELSFRWYKGTTPVMSGTTASGSVISGAASPRLTIANLTLADEGEYYVVIGNALGSVTTQNARVSLGCAADFNADDTVDFFDYVDFLTAFTNGDPVSDFNTDMEFDLFDYLDFVQHFANGC